MLRQSLHLADSHDSYAALWIAAECADLLATRACETEREKLIVRARSLGYSPLVTRLLDASGRTEIVGSSRRERNVA
jgi:hypothetical protein